MAQFLANTQRPPVPVQDPLAERDGKLTMPWLAFFNPVADVTTQGPTLVGTHAERINLDPNVMPYYAIGRFLRYLFVETDRRAIYLSTLVAGIPTWIWVSGGMAGASLADLPGDLGPDDQGFIFYDLLLKHSYRWSGLAWSFAPGDDMSGQIAPSAGGATPLGGVWQVCDGSTVQISKGDGTTIARTTPNFSGDVAILGASAESGQRPAVAATWAPGSITDDESAHTHNVNVGGDNSYMPGPPNITASPGGVYTSAAGTAHHHGLTDANAQLNPPSESDGGLGLRIALVWYMRR